MNGRPADRLAIAIAQLNPTVGDIAGNADKARRARAHAARDGADLVILPEMFICGYPPEDLVLKPALQAACRAAIEKLARETADGGPAMVIGTPWVENEKLYNACCVLDGGVDHRACGSRSICPITASSTKSGFSSRARCPGRSISAACASVLPVCEDIWSDEVVETLAETGAELLLVPNGSPYWRDKDDVRLNIAVARVTESGLPLIYVNEVGGQDELIFDGASFGLHADRSLAFQLPAFREQVTTVRWQRSGNSWRCIDGPIAKLQEADQDDYCACVLGLRDYVDKNGFKGVVLGLSGGIDSALVAAMAVDALGAERVRCVMLPYRFTAQVSLDDAAATAKALGVQYDVVPIEAAVLGLEEVLAPLVQGEGARRHRGKSTGAGARHDPDGDLQQVRSDGGDHRQ